MTSLLSMCIIVPLAAVLFALFYNKPVILIHFQIVFYCTMKFFKCYLGVNENIKMFMDVINIWLIVLVIFKLKREHKYMEWVKPLIGTLLFVLVSIASWVYNEQSIVLYLWCMRTVLRFMCFFVACVTFLRVEDVKRIVKILFVLLGVNTLLSIFQYFVQGYTFDFNGGLFGFERGCNGDMNLFITQITVYAVVLFMYKQLETKYLIYVVSCCLIISALSELKMYFFEIVIVIICVILTQKPTIRTVISIFVTGIGVFLGIQIFLLLYPDWGDFFNIDSIVEYSTMDYSLGEESVNRLSGISQVCTNVLKNTPLQLIGKGSGSAQEAFGKVGDVMSKHGLMHCEWFSHTLFMVESGFLGLITYFSFYSIAGVKSIRYMIKSKKYKCYHVVSFVTSILMILYFIYNSSTILEAGYLISFWVAFSFIFNKEEVLQYETKSEHCNTYI